MNAIGFKNFRNFVEFPTMPTNGVTILVGGNNVGKSTCTKAYRLLAKNLEKNIIEGIMTYNEDSYLYLHDFDFSSVCGNFERALSKSATDDIIEINAQMGYFDITLRITSKNKKNIFANIQSIEIKDILDDCSWTWTTGEGEQSVFRYSGKTLVNLLRLEEIEISKKLRQCREILQTKENDMRKKAEKVLSILEKSLTFNKAAQDKYKNIHSIKPFHNYSLIPFDLHGHKIILDGEHTDIIRSGIEDWEIYADNKWNLKGYAKIFSDFFKHIREDLKRTCNHNRIMYFPAHESPLDSFFNLNHNEYDNNAFSICSFYREYYHRSDWVRSRMKELGIGEDFNIEPANSDYLYVTITNSNGKRIPLADNGRGAVQLFILLLRLAMYAYKTESETEIEDTDEYFPSEKIRENSITNLIIFEEPEQNLHPNLQSKLADLFLAIHKDCKANILVETHSEYLVRRSQVLVAEAKFKDEQELADKCPFKVYYFPENETGKPYDMKFLPNGRFKQQFGKGFFDEASSLALNIF